MMKARSDCEGGQRVTEEERVIEEKATQKIQKMIVQ